MTRFAHGSTSSPRAMCKANSNSPQTKCCGTTNGERARSVTLAAEEIPDADLHFPAGKVPDRLTELWTANRVDVRDVVAVEDVEHFDEHRHRVPAHDDLLLRSEVEIGVGLDAERVAWLRQVALIDEPIPVAVEDAAR